MNNQCCTEKPDFFITYKSKTSWKVCNNCIKIPIFYRHIIKKEGIE